MIRLIWFTIYQIQEIIGEAVKILNSNISGPRGYLQMYDNFLYILDGQAERDLEGYFALDPLPQLREFGHKIEGYDNLIKEVFLFRNKVRFQQLFIFKR